MAGRVTRAEGGAQAGPATRECFEGLSRGALAGIGLSAILLCVAMPLSASAKPGAQDGVGEIVELPLVFVRARADEDFLLGVGSLDSAVRCFEALFGNGAIDVRIAQVRRIVVGSCAIHHVVEEVRVSAPEGQVQRAFVLATNVFAKSPQGWRLLVHHASPGSAREVQEFSDEPSTLH